MKIDYKELVHSFCVSAFAKKPQIVRQVQGGDTHDSFVVVFNDTKSFIKVASGSKKDLLNSEHDSLIFLNQLDFIISPGITGFQEFKNHLFLCLEYLELSELSYRNWEDFGKKLAMLHNINSLEYGWDKMNYVGLWKQKNDRTDSFKKHVWDYRFLPLITSVEDYFRERRQELFELEDIISDSLTIYKPSLIHGDLWSGNFAMCHGEPIIFDPAISYSCPLFDLAMMELFGSVPRVFYESYCKHGTLPINFKRELSIYQIYYLLIHVYMFGHAYVSQVNQKLDEIRY